MVRSLSNIVIDQNDHDITNFTNLTTLALYKILKVRIINVNIQIMKWHNELPGSKNVPPPKVAARGYGPCGPVHKYGPASKANVRKF